eukprot:Blabericola_migrator_1__9012@NODE_479_length_8179_cov_106_519354_g373_i0_p1_GENE_NODE_479_length_8179_cov_106_519354_g373_i0NODE_479_length_8179_cov_106_519354_g373_i0_p1_ORF_typecomplete_len526_score58_92DUF1908/PF08926_11/1_9e02_NODE_479_length_8179_cov_106_519354_g373_i039955572
MFSHWTRKSSTASTSRNEPSSGPTRHYPVDLSSSSAGSKELGLKTPPTPQRSDKRITPFPRMRRQTDASLSCHAPDPPVKHKGRRVIVEKGDRLLLTSGRLEVLRQAQRGYDFGRAAVTTQPASVDLLDVDDLDMDIVDDMECDHVAPATRPATTRYTFSIPEEAPLPPSHFHTRPTNASGLLDSSSRQMGSHHMRSWQMDHAPFDSYRTAPSSSATASSIASQESYCPLLPHRPSPIAVIDAANANLRSTPIDRPNDHRILQWPPPLPMSNQIPIFSMSKRTAPRDMQGTSFDINCSDSATVVDERMSSSKLDKRPRAMSHLAGLSGEVNSSAAASSYASKDNQHHPPKPPRLSDAMCTEQQLSDNRTTSTDWMNAFGRSTSIMLDPYSASSREFIANRQILYLTRRRVRYHTTSPHVWIVNYYGSWTTQAFTRCAPGRSLSVAATQSAAEPSLSAHVDSRMARVLGYLELGGGSLTISPGEDTLHLNRVIGRGGTSAVFSGYICSDSLRCEPQQPAVVKVLVS